MATWVVKGIDRSTQQEVTRTIEADNEEGARQAASVIGIDAKEVSPHMAHQAAAAPTPSFERVVTTPTVVPHYGDITRGASVLDGLAMFVTIIGYLFVIVGIVTLVSAIFGRPYVIIPGLYLILIGIFYFIGAAVLRMIASVGIAVRDIAVNSFRK